MSFGEVIAAGGVGPYLASASMLLAFLIGSRTAAARQVEALGRRLDAEIERSTALRAANEVQRLRLIVVEDACRKGGIPIPPVLTSEHPTEL